MEEFTNELYNNLEEQFEMDRKTANANADKINTTITTLANEYGIKTSDTLKEIWSNGGYTPEKGFTAVCGKIDKLIEASNLQADQQADALVYNDVKDKYDKNLSSYENNVSTAQNNYNNIVSQKNDISSQLAKAKEKLAKYVVQKTDKNGNITTTYKKGYEAQKKKVDDLKAQLKQIKINEQSAKDVLSEAQNAYNSVLASDKSVVQDFLSKIVNATTSKSADQMTELDKVINQLTGGYIEDYNVQQLADLLGTSTNVQEILNMLQKLGFSWKISAMKYKSGSKNIPYDQLAWTQDGGGEMIYRSTDGAILTPLGKGDKVFTNQMSENLWELAKMNPVQFSGVNITPTLPAFERNVGGVGDTNINLGGITMYGVNDPETFGRQLREEICKNGKTTKCLTEVVSSVQLGKGVGKANLYRH